MQVKNLQHQKIKIGSLPFIDQVLDRLQISDIVGSSIKNKRYIGAIEVLLKSILLEPAALYRIPAWAKQFEARRVSGGVLGDDLLGRALDKLFLADRSTLQTKLTLQTIEKYDVDTSEIHNDSTTVKFFGAYNGQSAKAVKLKRGHSKDHRPDLKQLVYNLSITADGSIPIHFKAYDGNSTDDQLHIETWLTLRGMLGKSDFLYVADSKLCTSANMRKIDREGGRFVTIVPKTRAETKDFYKLCHNAEVRWLPLTRRESSRHKGKYDVFQVAEGIHQLSEGFRVYWYRSSEKRRRDEDSRRERISAVLEKLADLENKRRRGPKTEKSLLKAAQQILDKYKASSLIHIEVKSKEVEQFKKTSAGNPGPEATYRRLVKKIPYLVVRKNHEGIAQSSAIDGVFPLTTNAKLDAKETLKAYKYQPFLEKRFSWIKSDYEVSPVFLKKTERIEALMFVCYMADLVAAIIQREIRLAMAKKGIESLRILPEERPTRTPTWEQIQRLFAQHSKYELQKGAKVVASFWDNLSPHQVEVIRLLRCKKLEFSN